ncbi:MAG: hypothetical protein EA381_17285, partial [Planctomycetaceae bacterium]
MTPTPQLPNQELHPDELLRARDRLRQLLDRYDLLLHDLDLTLLESLRRRRRPDDASLTAIRDLLALHDATIDDLRANQIEIAATSTVPELLSEVEQRLHEQASWESFRIEAEGFLRRLLTITVSPGAEPQRLEEFHLRVAVLLEELPAGDWPAEVWSARLQPYRDFWRMLSEPHSLSVEEEETIADRVETELGRHFVRPAFFRQLVIPADGSQTDHT